MAEYADDKPGPADSFDRSDERRQSEEWLGLLDEHDVKNPLETHSDPSHIKGLLPRGTDARTIAWSEAVIIARSTRTIAITQLLEWSLYSINLFMLGHLGTKYLAAATLSNTTFNFLAMSIMIGFCGALDSLCTHSWSAKPKETSLHAQRMAFLLLCMAVVQCTFLSVAAEHIFRLLRQGEETSRLAARYLRVQCFGLIPLVGFETLRRYLQSMNVMKAPATVIACVVPFNIGLAALLVFGPASVNLGFLGGPVAFLISSTLLFALLATYTYLYVPRDGHAGFTTKAFTNLGQIIRLGLFSTAQLISEWYAWECLILMSALIGDTSYLAAMSVCLNTASLLYQSAMAVNISAAVRVGNLLGCNRPDLARLSARTSIALSACIGLISAVILAANKSWWGKVFDDDPVVVAIVAEALPVVAVFVTLDCLTGVTNGILRGAALPHLGAYLNMTCLLGGAVPLAALLCFKADLKVTGLCAGMAIALTLSSSGGIFIVSRIRWEERVNVVAKQESAALYQLLDVEDVTAMHVA
ncbi:uncharacterized protein L969DRAFT_50996 [Mixia osmundae IAM 14324]|uniref:MATE efflux family protein n=1 Tax=Mixia osmundae (strain CBS 9802 / IAM 14324 / JCM 22182 / KY 12970) TaxID=764103 RepID=G7E819_MIXOS|nr:uncharacterized protein L969DRAFT_50996 [Mixia osmundae IAM 14324]KEI38580.1 hypothetical protein L969DRAFT_50996 [Mixia osmundae IAM 14324]GAA98979.1 hypothetical protein E5Q_05668 [Mixia osmundae IAM 14324]